MSSYVDQLKILKGSNSWRRLPGASMRGYLLASTHNELQEKLGDAGTLKLRPDEVVFYSKEEFPNELTFDKDLGVLKDAGFDVISDPKNIEVYHRRSGLLKYLDRRLKEKLVLSLKEVDNKEIEEVEPSKLVELFVDPNYVEPEEESERPVRNALDNMAKKIKIKPKIATIKFLKPIV